MNNNTNVSSTNIPSKFGEAKVAWHHWYAARYARGDENVAKSLRVIMRSMMQEKSLSAFLTDFTESAKNIAKELEENPNYYESKDQEPLILKGMLVGKYVNFANYEKFKNISVDRVLPTVAAIRHEPVAVKMTQGRMQCVVGSACVSFAEMKKIMAKQLEEENIKHVMQDKSTAILVSEVSGNTYEKVEKKLPIEVSVEDKTSAKVVVDFVKDIKNVAKDKTYSDYLAKSLSNNRTEIPIVTKDEKVLLTLPVVMKNFLVPGRIVNQSDVAQAIQESYGLVSAGKTDATMKQECITALNAQEMPEALLYNTSWLEQMDIRKIQQYVPVFIGSKNCSWLMLKTDNSSYKPSKDMLKNIYVMIQKFAKFFGLWLRGGLSGKLMETYLERALGYNCAKSYGYVLHTNLKVWCGDYIIDKFKAMGVVKNKNLDDFYLPVDPNFNFAEYVDKDEDYIPFEDDTISFLDRDAESTQKERERERNNQRVIDTGYHNRKEKEIVITVDDDRSDAYGKNSRRRSRSRSRNRRHSRSRSRTPERKGEQRSRGRSRSRSRSRSRYRDRDDVQRNRNRNENVREVAKKKEVDEKPNDKGGSNSEEENFWN